MDDVAGQERLRVVTEQDAKRSCKNNAFPSQLARRTETLQSWTATGCLREIHAKPVFQQVATRALQLINPLFLQIQHV